MRKQRLREGKLITQGHRASQDLTTNPNILTPGITEHVPSTVPFPTRDAKRGKLWATPQSLGLSWEMGLASAQCLCCPDLCASHHPGLPVSTPTLCDPLATEQPGVPKRNNCDPVTPLFATFQRLPIALRMKLELPTRACKASLAWLLPPSLISSPGLYASHTAPPLGSPGHPQTPRVPLR